MQEHTSIDCNKKMQSMTKKKKAANSNSNVNNSDGANQKQRRIVSWSQEEDDILREQIRIDGTDNWTIIASNFKDKTTRQCKRRWFTYLNSDFKKGGWSPEEDMLLCEAQKIFGNRWTEIAKVVSGRTDNAVKNRFTTLCKKKAKHEALAKENSTSYINLNNKRIIFPYRLDIERISDVSEPIKRLRKSHILDDYVNKNQPHRRPFTVLTQNFHIAGGNALSHQHVNNMTETSENASNNKSRGTFLKKNDPKISVLMQQAELLSSLALNVNAEYSNQSLENTYKDFLHQTKEGDMLKLRLPETNSGHDTQMDLIIDSSSNEGIRPSKGQPAISEVSVGSSEYGTGSTLLSHALGDKTEGNQVKPCAQSSQIGDQTGVQELENGICCDLSPPHDTLPVCDETRVNHGLATVECEYPEGDFSSPLQVTPPFRSLAAAIPSPKFSESERQFLLKTLGVEPTSPHRSTQPPSCKRALLQSL
ncbi:transcription factor MYB124-like isoform X2 [Lycium ferocissimum]|uniref:transcription factor MYB124-like isoform X2 n=1 Tax=Lycium ferocissimum TaxID=112874 RepID=UPI002815BB69|nr:transcription factor MYB124-like isoform X2 [Lycium ferocissimum]